MNKFLILVVLAILAFAHGRIERSLEVHLAKFAKYQQQSVNGTCYGVNFDVGSSGTRVYVYKWSCRRTQQAPDLDISSDTLNTRKTPGLSTFASNLDGIPAYFDPLMAFANQTVPVAQRKFVPIYLRATAGMRLLTLAQQTAILDRARGYLRNSGYMFNANDWAKVLSGEEEGVYGFLSVNYLLGNIKPTVSPSTSRLVMDLGGASTQITFVPATKPTQNNYTLVIPGYPEYNTYTYSFLNFGNDAARNSTIFLAPLSGDTVSFPCFFTGYSEKRSDSASIYVNGTSNYTSCVDLVRNNFKVCASGDCTINSVYLAPIPATMSLHGLGVFTSLGATLTPSATSYTIATIRSKAQEICALNWTQIQTLYPGNNFINQFCYQLVLVSELVTFAYKIDATRTIDVRGNIAPVTASWTLGAMLVDIGNLKCSTTTGELCVESSASTYGVSGILFAVLMTLIPLLL